MRRAVVVSWMFSLVVAAVLAPSAAAQVTDPEPPSSPDLQRDPDNMTAERMTTPRSTEPAAPGTPFVAPGNESLEEAQEGEAFDEPEMETTLASIVLVGLLAALVIALLVRRGGTG